MIQTHSVLWLLMYIYINYQIFLSDIIISVLKIFFVMTTKSLDIIIEKMHICLPSFLFVFDLHILPLQQAVDDGLYSTNGFIVISVVLAFPPSPTPQDDDDDGLSDGQIAGIVIGVVVGVFLLVVIIILVVYCFWCVCMRVCLYVVFVCMCVCA